MRAATFAAGPDGSCAPLRRRWYSASNRLGSRSSLHTSCHTASSRSWTEIVLLVQIEASGADAFLAMRPVQRYEPSCGADGAALVE